MNFSSLLGTIIIGLVIYFGVVESSHDPAIFLNVQAIILVLGGTLGIALLAFPLKRLKDSIDFMIYGIFLKKRQDDIKNVVDLIRIAHFYQMNQKDFLQHIQINYIFLMEAAVLLSQERLSVDEINLILHNRRNSFKKKYTEEYKMLLAISKFPPGLGLLGSSVGMIEMMSSISQMGLEGAGSSMAIALVSTFWGVAAANFVFLPLTDYAQRVAAEDLFSRDLVIHGIVMIKQGFPVASVSEAMISELPIVDQMMLRNLIFKNQSLPSGEGVSIYEGTRSEMNKNFFEEARTLNPLPGEKKDGRAS